MKNTIYRMTFALAAALLSLTSCVKDELFNTPHPDRGALILTPDWTNRSTTCPAPADYTVLHTCCTPEVCTLPATDSRCHPSLFTQGTHTLVAHTSADHISIDGLTATIATATDGGIHHMPGYLLTAALDADIIRDDTTRLTIHMHQRLRDLNIEFTITEGDPTQIAAATGTLTGVAPAFDLARQTLTGTPSTARLTFTRSGSKLTASARLFGFITSAPAFTLDILFTDGRTQTIRNDRFADAVKDFNLDMTAPLTLSNRLHLPIEAGMDATIDHWNPGNSSGEDIELH